MAQRTVFLKSKIITKKQIIELLAATEEQRVAQLKTCVRVYTNTREV